MNQPRFTNVSRGKPTSCELAAGSVKNWVDLLWPYHISRIAIDSWIYDGKEPTSNSQVDSTNVVIESSLDGETWEARDAELVKATEKSTLGTGPTYVAIFKSAPLARFISVRCFTDDRRYRLRCLAKAGSILKDETQKYVLTDKQDHLVEDVGVVVVGGSNTVMRYGWSRALSVSPTRVEAAAALGASSNIFAVRTLGDHPQPNAEVLLYNANVIEYPLMKFEEYDYELARDATKHVLAYCDKHELFPINIIWPEQNYIDASESGDLVLGADTYFANLSYELSIPFVDGYRVLSTVIEHLGRDRRSLFRDTAHLNHFAAQIIGRAISKVVGQLKAEGTLSKRTTANQLTRPFKALDLSEYADVESESITQVLTVSNSLITQDFIVLGTGRPVHIQIDKGWEVVGYLINARHCNGAIKLEGENTVVKRAVFKAFNASADAAPFVCARALPHPVRPDENGTVSVSVTLPSNDDIADRLLSGAGPSVEDQLMLEVGQLIIRSQLSNEHRASVSGTDLDFTGRVIQNLETEN